MAAINRAPFNALIDDDGSNTVGTVWNKAQIQGVILDPVDAALASTVTAVVPATITITTTGTIPILPVPVGKGDYYIVMNNATPATVQGISLTGVASGQRVTIVAHGALVTLQYMAGGAGNNALLNKASASLGTVLLGGGSAEYVFDPVTAVWRMVAHEQGAWLTPAYSAANFTSSAGTWTVDAGDITTYAYRLSGRTLTVSWYLQATSVTGAPTVLRIAVPGGFTVAGSGLHPYVHDDAGAGNAGSFCLTGTATIDCYKAYGVGSFAAATNTTRLFGTITFPVT